MWNKLVNKLVYYLPPVEVISPDQFVPLFLAHTVDTGNPYAADINGFDKQAARHHYMDLFNRPYPKRYSTPVPRMANRHDQIQSIYTDLFIGSMPGTVVLTPNTLVMPGLFAKLNSRVHAQLESLIHPFGGEVEMNAMSSIDPVILVLVKAKHIPLLRVAIHLTPDAPMELPLPDMKVLRRPAVGSIEMRHVADFMVQSGLETLVNEQGLSDSYVAKEVMQAFLFTKPPEHTQAELLRFAVRVAKEEIQEPVLEI